MDTALSDDKKLRVLKRLFLFHAPLIPRQNPEIAVQVQGFLLLQRPLPLLATPQF